MCSVAAAFKSSALTLRNNSNSACESSLVSKVESIMAPVPKAIDLEFRWNMPVHKEVPLSIIAPWNKPINDERVVNWVGGFGIINLKRFGLM